MLFLPFGHCEYSLHYNHSCVSYCLNTYFFRFFYVHTWGVKWLGHIVILFNLLKNHQTIFCDGLCYFKFHQPCMRFPISLHTSPLSIAALMGVKQYLITVWILHFSNDMEHLFKCCLLAIFIFSVKKCQALCPPCSFQRMRLG